MFPSRHCSASRSTSLTTSQNLLRNALLLIVAPALLHAQDKAQDKLSLDTTRSEVHFTLADALHTVHGTFHLQQGDISFDPATGKADGSILVDALSGKSGNSVRDRRISHEIDCASSTARIFSSTVSFRKIEGSCVK